MCWGDARSLSDAQSLKLSPRLTAPLGFQILQSDRFSSAPKLPMTPRLRPSVAPFDLELLDALELPDSAVQMPSEFQLQEAMHENARKACRKPRLRPSNPPFDIELLEALELPESAIQMPREQQLAPTDEPASSSAPRELGLAQTRRQFELELMNSSPRSARAREPPAAPRLRPLTMPLQSLQLLPFLELPESVATGTPSTPRLEPTSPPFGVSKELPESTQAPSLPSSIFTILSSLQKRDDCKVDDMQEVIESSVEEETLIFELDDDEEIESSCATEDTPEFSLEEIVSSAIPTADCSQNFKENRAIRVKPWGASQYAVRERKDFEDESPVGSSLCSTCASPPTPSLLCKGILITDQVDQL